MPGLVPGIHVLPQGEGVDGRDKPGYDDHERSCPINFVLTLFLTARASLAIGGSVLFPEGRAREAS